MDQPLVDVWPRAIEMEIGGKDFDFFIYTHIHSNPTLRILFLLLSFPDPSLILPRSYSDISLGVSLLLKILGAFAQNHEMYK